MDELANNAPAVFASTASLRERVCCPGCKRMLTRRCLLYRHSCKLSGEKTFEIRKRRADTKMEAMIAAHIAAQEQTYDTIVAH